MGGMPPSRRTPFWTYVALQAPHWGLAALIGWWIQGSFDLPAWVATAIPTAVILMDLAMYPVVGYAYNADEGPPVERLVGQYGVAVERLAPTGYVRIGSELWRARTTDAAPIARDLPVEVVAAEGLVLSVRRAAD